MLNWFHELSEEDIPPAEIYGQDERLVEWFDAVKQRQKDKYSSGSNEALEEVPQVSNDLVKELNRNG